MSLLEKLHERAGKPAFFGFLATLAFFDYLTVFVPIDIALVLGVLVQPTRWVRTGLCMAIASTAGGMLIVALVSWSPGYLHAHVSTTGHWAEAWALATAWIKTLGPWALIVSALAPVPQHPVLILATLGGLPPFEIGVAFLVGRLIKFLGMAYLTATSPPLLAKIFPRLRGKLLELGYELPV